MIMGREGVVWVCGLLAFCYYQDFSGPVVRMFWSLQNVFVPQESTRNEHNKFQLEHELNGFNC